MLSEIGQGRLLGGMSAIDQKSSSKSFSEYHFPAILLGKSMSYAYEIHAYFWITYRLDFRGGGVFVLICVYSVRLFFSKKTPLLNVKLKYNLKVDTLRYCHIVHDYLETHVLIFRNADMK